MNMKRFLSFLMVVTMCFALVACGGAKQETPATTEQVQIQTTAPATTEPEATEPAEPQVGDAKPLLYRVTDAEGHTAWLFGSIHVGRENYYPLPSYVQNAFDGADALAVELDINAFEQDLAQQMQAVSVLVYRDGTTIADHISEELYTKSVETLKALNTYAAALDLYCPAFWSSAIDSLLVEQMGARIDLGIDRHLLTQAAEAGKPIRDIESAKAQYEMMAGFSDELQALMLESSLASYENPEEGKKELDELMNLWASGDEAAFAAYLAAENDDIPAALAAEYNKAMLTDRNILMADYVEAALQSGDEVFVCVGAAHVVGEGAMVQLLTQRGYTVELVMK